MASASRRMRIGVPRGIGNGQAATTATFNLLIFLPFPPTADSRHKTERHPAVGCDNAEGMTSDPDLSVIVPFYNEEESIGAMHSAIVAAVEPLGIRFEMIFVDDGSRDRTLEVATAIARDDERVRVVKFRRNYGQTPAMAAGIEHARGRVLVTMDGDLQNDPRDIGTFLAKIDEGNDIVVGWRHNRQDKLISRKIPSKIATWTPGKVTGVPVHDNGCW